MSNATTGNGKFVVTYADGKTRNYSRKIDVTRAAKKSGQEYLIVDPKGVEVERSAKFDAVAEVAPVVAPAPAPVADAKPAKPAKAKPAKAKADAPARAKVGTFEVAGKDTQKCVGACGEKKPVKAFPTVTGRPEVRVAECRVCRDTRTKAEKAAKAAS